MCPATVTAVDALSRDLTLVMNRELSLKYTRKRTRKKPHSHRNHFTRAGCRSRPSCVVLHLFTLSSSSLSWLLTLATLLICMNVTHSLTHKHIYTYIACSCSSCTRTTSRRHCNSKTRSAFLSRRDDDG